MDPNMNMPMVFNQQNQDPQSQQFNQNGMMPNQFMQMQNLMGMQMQNQFNSVPTIIHFKNVEKTSDGSSIQENRKMTISPLDPSMDV